MPLLAKRVCVIQEWLNELEAFQLLQYGSWDSAGNERIEASGTGV